MLTSILFAPTLAFTQPVALFVDNSSQFNRLSAPVITRDGNVYVVGDGSRVLHQDGTSLDANIVRIEFLNSTVPIYPVHYGEEVLLAGTNFGSADSTYTILAKDGTVVTTVTPGDLSTENLRFLRGIAYSYDPPAPPAAPKFLEPSTASVSAFFLEVFGLIDEANKVERELVAREKAPGIREATRIQGGAVPTKEVLLNAAANINTAIVIDHDLGTSGSVVMHMTTPPPLQDVPGALSEPGLELLSFGYDLGGVTGPGTDQRIFTLPVDIVGNALPPSTQMVSWDQAAPLALLPPDPNGSRIENLAQPETILVRGSQSDFRSTLAIAVNPAVTRTASSSTCQRADLNNSGGIDEADSRLFFDALLNQQPAADINQDGVVNDRDARLFLRCVKSAKAARKAGDEQVFALLRTGTRLPMAPEFTVDFVTGLASNALGAAFIKLRVISNSGDQHEIILTYDEQGFREAMRTGVDYGEGVVTSLGAFSQVNPSGQVAINGRVAGQHVVYRLTAQNLAVPEPTPPGTEGWMFR